MKKKKGDPSAALRRAREKADTEQKAWFDSINQTTDRQSVGENEKG